ncbi:type VII secretion protein EccB [Amycolatopsis sp. NBRC 101858]|uniref:type VII secretion protein EccB n=1 Tax=Amycolatopsis sp. NBRC 101858 TaxID=3032200 RepID=UPI0024A5460A|nr:type VII secretion protein EccB [Amycolatopsis sp. NBRC 101858]GLY41280.1 type VII secretion protein EccB [Amycolatopsis sp. NBRC 101858]
MPSTPTTKSQVQAYKFVLRRMQSALVRRDAVMLHDPMRTHTRATIVGVVLGALGMIVFVVWGLLSPAPSVPEAGNIVIGEQSGTVYVVMGNPKMLVPTFNLASARLLLLAQQKQPTGNNPGAAPAATPAAATPAAVKNPTVVSDDQLKDIPRGKLTGIPDGPQLIPTDSQRISPNWAVCDQVQLDPTLPVPDSVNQTNTYVFGGVAPSALGTELGDNEALLAKADNGKTYLVYRLPSTQNRPNANTVRAEIDASDTRNAVSTALQLNQKPRKITQGLLNAIPEVPPLTPPQVADGSPPADLGGLTAGDVFSTQPTGEQPQYWAITTTGIQRVSQAVADVMRVAKHGSASELRTLGLDKLSGVHVLQPGEAGYIPVDEFPRSVPTVLDATKNSAVACLGWSVVGDGANRDGHTSVYIETQLPGQNSRGAKFTTTKVTTPGPNRVPINGFYLQPGFGAVVQSATGQASFGKGAIQLISDRGIRYSVPDATTADAIGLGNRQPAPESIIGLLPTGASLNTQDVLKQFDSVPIDPNAGSFPTAQAGG